LFQCLPVVHVRHTNKPNSSVYQVWSVGWKVVTLISAKSQHYLTNSCCRDASSAVFEYCIKDRPSGSLYEYWREIGRTRREETDPSLIRKTWSLGSEPLPDLRAHACGCRSNKISLLSVLSCLFHCLLINILWPTRRLSRGSAHHALSKTALWNEDGS